MLDNIFKEGFEQIKFALLFVDILVYFFEVKFLCHLVIKIKLRYIIVTSYLKIKHQAKMANRFEYNFTRESEYQELKERNQELEEENNILKQSLEELIRVNTELTESIEELNNNGTNGGDNNQEIQSKMEMLINQNQQLRQVLEQQMEINQDNKKSNIQEDDQTESLVNVLEELIESFKSIELKYQNEIKQLQLVFQEKNKEFQEKLAKLHQELQGRVNTIEALSVQLKRKDQNLQHIISSVKKFEKENKQQSNGKHYDQIFQQIKGADPKEIQTLEKKLETINKELSEKNKVINVYEHLLTNLKGKIMEKV